jgi:hypothetical protein
MRQEVLSPLSYAHAGLNEGTNILEIAIRFERMAVVRSMSGSLKGLPEMIPAVLLVSTAACELAVERGMQGHRRTSRP